MEDKKIPNVLPLLVLVPVLLLSGFAAFIAILIGSLESAPTTIEEMDSELKILLFDRYKLNITEDIVFVDGYYDNAFQDNSIHLTLKVPNDNLKSFYNKEHYEETVINETDNNGRMIKFKRLIFDGELYTNIDFYAQYKEYTIIKFRGRYPFKTD